MQGASNFHEDLGAKCEGHRAEARDSEGPRAEVLGEGLAVPSPSARGLEELCKLPQWGLEHSRN